MDKQYYIELFNDLMDLYEFEIYKDNNGYLRVKDLQGANLGDIESDEFEDYAQIIDRMSVYHEDYIIRPIENITLYDSGNLRKMLAKLRKNINKWAEIEWDIRELDLIINACDYLKGVKDNG